MRRLLGNIISVLWTMPRLLIKKLMHGSKFRSGIIERISPNVVLDFWRGSTVELGEKVRAHSGCILRVLSKGRLKIGDNVRMNYRCVFMCMDSISVGEGTVFGPSVYVYDHDHDYAVGIEKDEYKTEPVVIGALLRVAEHFIGFGDLFELLLRRFVSGIFIRMIFTS